MSHKDLLDKNAEGNHKFGMGVGILASSVGATHGAGPSGHNTMVRVMSTSKDDDSLAMEVDTPSSQSPAPASVPKALTPPPTFSTLPAASTPEAPTPAPPTDPATITAPTPSIPPSDDAMIVEPTSAVSPTPGNPSPPT